MAASSSSANKGKKRRRNGAGSSSVAYASRYYGQMGSEMKFFETDLAVTGTNTGVIEASLNLVPEGTTQSQRIGRKMTIKGVYIRGVINADSTTPTPDRMRVIVYQDKQANGATATAANILDSPTSGLINGFRNLTETGRFRILKDETYDVNIYNGNATAAIRRTRVTYKCYLANLNIPIEFSSTTGAITEIRSNNVGMLFITTLASGSAASDFVGTARIRYVG